MQVPTSKQSNSIDQNSIQVHPNTVGSSQRPSYGDLSNAGGQGVLGGLIDVRPKVLHSNIAGQDVRKSYGKGKDNIQTVIGTEKIMIQSKPRGLE